jgi:hypothetical protein
MLHFLLQCKLIYSSSIKINFVDSNLAVILTALPAVSCFWPVNIVTYRGSSKYGYYFRGSSMGKFLGNTGLAAKASITEDPQQQSETQDSCSFAAHTYIHARTYIHTQEGLSALT